MVTVEFTSTGSTTWAGSTAPTINAQIIGPTQIQGAFDEQGANDLADALNNH